MPEEQLPFDPVLDRINTAKISLPSDPKWVAALQRKLSDYERRERPLNRQVDYCIIILSQLLQSGTVSAKEIADELMKSRPGEFDAPRFQVALDIIDNYATFGASGGRPLPDFELPRLETPERGPKEATLVPILHPESMSWRQRLWKMFGGS